jgi:hypothetical protein
MTNRLARGFFGAWLVLAFGCGSGGRDPVRPVSTGGEDPGPLSAGQSPPAATSTATSATSTLLVLCMKACAHVRSADCKAMPAWGARDCETECTYDGGVGIRAECTDELAAYYACVIAGDVKCESSSGAPVFECTEVKKAYDQCVTPQASGTQYAGCTRRMDKDAACATFSWSPKYFECTSSTQPSPACTKVSFSAPYGFCCP